MPTGYTYALHKGRDITSHELAMIFARGMTLSIHQRDEDLSNPVRRRQESSYYPQQIEQTINEIAEWEAASSSQVQTWLDERIAFIKEENKALREEKRRLAERYDRASRVLGDWKPETEAGRGVKKFALQQIRESKNADVHDYQLPLPQSNSAEDYRASKLEELRNRLDYLEKAAQEDRERVAEFNRLIDDFYSDLETLDDVRIT